jgi:hypothetical protein
MKFPIQPIRTDRDGVVRFVPNKIVLFLLATGTYNLNKLADLRVFEPDDWEQFAQLIGYSVDGWSELSYVTAEAREICQGAVSRGFVIRDTGDK